MLAMISQPMGDLSDEEINETRTRVAQTLANHNIYTKNTFFSFPDNIAKNEPLYYLAKCLEAMADVDLVYFCKGWEKNRGCRIEYQVAVEYGLKIFLE